MKGENAFYLVVGIAFGVLAMDVAHDYQMAKRPVPVVMDSNYPPVPVQMSEKVCAHYQAMGEGWKCQ